MHLRDHRFLGVADVVYFALIFFALQKNSTIQTLQAVKHYVHHHHHAHVVDGRVSKYRTPLFWLQHRSGCIYRNENIDIY